ncbi:unnamed protein product, partial [Prorocentrum cordatum]
APGRAAPPWRAAPRGPPAFLPRARRRGPPALRWIPEDPAPPAAAVPICHGGAVRPIRRQRGGHGAPWRPHGRQPRAAEGSCREARVERQKSQDRELLARCWQVRDQAGRRGRGGEGEARERGAGPEAAQEEDQAQGQRRGQPLGRAPTAGPGGRAALHRGEREQLDQEPDEGGAGRGARPAQRPADGRLRHDGAQGARRPRVQRPQPQLAHADPRQEAGPRYAAELDGVFTGLAGRPPCAAGVDRDEVARAGGGGRGLETPQGNLIQWNHPVRLCLGPSACPPPRR